MTMIIMMMIQILRNVLPANTFPKVDNKDISPELLMFLFNFFYGVGKTMSIAIVVVNTKGYTNEPVQIRYERKIYSNKVDIIMNMMNRESLISTHNNFAQANVEIDKIINSYSIDKDRDIKLIPECQTPLTLLN